MVLAKDMGEVSPGGRMVTFNFAPFASGSAVEGSTGLTDLRKLDHSGTGTRISEGKRVCSGRLTS